ncbi:M28 family metallopeptidase [Mycoplasmopsis iners]|uniref:M28 family metallopeptidase n=1 Tax=Mycoplasmopsis iners TaxID=76630 RepID=UPI000495EA66|nr:M28 family peptidase [Mycoplasmopsis iners]
MKKSKFIKLLSIGSGLAFSPLVALAAACGTETKNDKDNDVFAEYKEKDVAKFYNDFLEKNHGRFAGNAFNIENYNAETGSFTGIEGDATSANLQYKNLLDKKIEANVNNYGSYHAFLYLKEEIKKLGYTNSLDTDTITYTSAVEIEKVGDASENKQTWQYKAKDGITSVKAGTQSVTSTENAEVTDIKPKGYSFKNDEAYENKVKEQMLSRTGYIAQGFTWHGPDTGNDNKYQLNNIGQNLIVSIQPENKQITDAAKATLKDIYIVAHYDSTSNSKYRLSWGATDNATGVASALALLKHYSSAEARAKLGTRLHIIFVDAEEKGKYGSLAFVDQFLSSKMTTAGDGDAATQTETNKLRLAAAAMINFDTVAGGDNMYVHSPDSRSGRGNVSSSVRDQINAISRIRAKNAKDIDIELEIHPQFEKDEFLAGETGDWSDHAGFYLKVGIPVAYVESTNFNVYSHSGLYDGYAQTYNPKAWLAKTDKVNENGLPIYKKVELVPNAKNGSNIILYDLPEEYASAEARENIVVWGDIWHSDLDRYDWVSENVGGKIYKQLDTVVETVKEYLTSVWRATDKSIELSI